MGSDDAALPIGIVQSVAPFKGIDADTTAAITYRQEQTPYGIDNYQAGVYYFNGKNVYNMRNYKIASGSDIKSLKVSPAGSSYAYIDSKKGKSTVRINDLWIDGEELGKIKDDSYAPTAICYSSDARRIYVAGDDDSLHVYDSRSFYGISKFLIGTKAKGLVASGNGYYLAACDSLGCQIINLQSKDIRQSLAFHAEIRDMAFSANSMLLAILTADGHCNVYDTRNFEVRYSYEAMGTAESCFFHPENKYMAVVTGDRRIAIVNLLNEKDRDYIDAAEDGVDYVNFVSDRDKGVYLVYNTMSSIVFYPVFYLSPNRQQLLREELSTRMEEWSKRMDGESLEDYNARVNDETRMEQIRLYETVIATRMADNLLTMSEVTLGNYNEEMQMLTLDINTMPSIYLSVPSTDLIYFMDAGALEFTNSKYCINEKDEFELVYTEVVNNNNGQTYVFDNTERASLAFLESDDNFIPLSQVQMSQMEEMKLEEMRDYIVVNARKKNIISEHTSIDVNTRIVNTTDASGEKITNYLVGISYTVDQEYSAQDDFGSGKYKTEESNAAIAMLEMVKKALEEDMSKYVVSGKRVEIMITGKADVTPFKHTVAYDGTYGNFRSEPVYKDGQLTSITVTTSTGISDNDQLAMLRAMGVRNYMQNNIPSLSTMSTNYNTSIEVSKKAGSQYRRIGVQLTFVDAF